MLQVRALAPALFALLPSLATATNGLNQIGFGTESVMMGGADVAVARDTTALNTNPAGLTQLGRPALDVYSATAYSLDVGHRDPINDVSVSNHFINIGGFGYARPLANSNVTAGIGMFVQGGAGNQFDSVNTGFGTSDELSALFGVVKFSAGAAWQVNDQLSVGASVAAIYSRVEQRIFPNTSVAAPVPFFGLQLRGVDGVNLGVRVGGMYKPDPRLTIGMVFVPKSQLTMDGGRAIVNMTAVGLGSVTYHDVRLSGLALPRELAFGAAWRATTNSLLSMKVDWLNWADALRSSTLQLGAPDQPAAPGSISQSSALNWRNQTVVSLGIAHVLNERTTLRAGFNYGRNPVPMETMSPLLASIGERHFTAGGSYRMSNGWELGGGVEYLPRASVSYSNPGAPLGVNAEEHVNYIAAHFMLSRRW